MQLGRELPSLIKLAPSVCPLWKQRRHQWNTPWFFPPSLSIFTGAIVPSVLFLRRRTKASCPHQSFGASLPVPTISHRSVREDAFRAEGWFQAAGAKRELLEASSPSSQKSKALFSSPVPQGSSAAALRSQRREKTHLQRCGTAQRRDTWGTALPC